METRGYYSLVQFLPNLSRHEAVNIGIVLYSPEEQRTNVRLLKANSRIRQFFGKQDWSFIEYSKEALRYRLQHEHFKSKGDLEAFISKRANSIQLTELHPASIKNLEADTERLFGELVAPQKVGRKKRIDKAFGDRLLEAGVRGLVDQSVQVRFPYFDEPLRAPYGYQNGRYNILSPIQFGSDSREVITKVGEKAVQGDLLFKNPDPIHGQLRLNVIAKFPDDLPSDARGLIEEVFGEHHVKLYSLDNLSPLLDDIREAAAEHGRKVEPVSEI